MEGLHSLEFSRQFGIEIIYLVLCLSKPYKSYPKVPNLGQGKRDCCYQWAIENSNNNNNGTQEIKRLLTTSTELSKHSCLTDKWGRYVRGVMVVSLFTVWSSQVFLMTFKPP